jgi:hypothetical protein
MPGTLTPMPDEPPDEPPDKPTAATEPTGSPADDEPGGIFSGYGIASLVLAMLSVAAVALVAVIWSAHRSDADERSYDTRVLQAAAEWTGVLINMNNDTVGTSLQKLHDGTVGELNADFDSIVEPYRQVVQTLQARTTGQIDAVALESIHHDLAPPSGQPPPAPDPQTALSGFASRTQTVLVVATSVTDNVGGKPRTVRWNLRLDVSDVDGKLLISRLEPIR